MSDEAPSSGQWQVVVEHMQRGWRTPTTQVHVFPQVYASPADALAEAHRRAFEFTPPKPARDKGRRVYADADGYLTVMVTGSQTGGAHFSTRVVQVVARPTDPTD